MIIMRVLGFSRFSLGWLLVALAVFPPGVSGQLRTVVSSEIVRSDRETSLRLDFQDDLSLSIEFQNGRVLVDGEEVGTYARRDALDSAWRSLLGDVIPLEDGPLAQALVDWTPPAGLADPWAEVAARLDRALETALSSPSSSEDLERTIRIAVPGEENILRELFGRPEALSGLAEALEGISLSRTSIVVGEDMVVEAEQAVEGTLILVDGDLEVAGLVQGDVILHGGSLRLLEGGRITGDVRVSNGEVELVEGSLDGSLVELEGRESIESAERELAELEAELQALRTETERRSYRDRERGRTDSNWATAALHRVSSAIGELLKNIMTFLVLCVLGVLAVHFQGDRLEIVATTARRAPTRSAVVGLAGGFLLLPVWILGAVALAISIVGIPVLLAWIPVFPIVAGFAALLGYLAVARNVGEWVADQEYRGLEWIRGSNSFYTVVAGIGALMLPCIASNLVYALGVGFLAGILSFVGTMITLAAATVGLGAVLLTRGGRIRPHESYFDFEDEFWVEAEPVKDDHGEDWDVASQDAGQGESDREDTGDDHAQGDRPGPDSEPGPGPSEDTGEAPGEPPDSEEERDEDV
jgi:hypothetical protein